MEFLQNNWYWAALAAVSGSFLLFETFRQHSGGSSLSPVQATMMINREDALMVDLRDQNDFQQGHIPNAKHIPLAALEKRVGDLAKYKQSPIILCCGVGTRSAAAVGTLRKQGFEKVYNLQGGLNAWQQAGQPVSRKRK